MRDTTRPVPANSTGLVPREVREEMGIFLFPATIRDLRSVRHVRGIGDLRTIRDIPSVAMFARTDPTPAIGVR